MPQFTTNAGLLRILDFLKEDITQVAIADGAAPTVGSTKLNGEKLRRPVLDPIVDGFTLVADGYFDETEGNGEITAWGVFADGASEATNSGTLFAATDSNMVKSEGESLTLSAEITVRRV